jgi:hypothetical protein
MGAKMWLGSLKGRDPLEDLGADGRTVLRWFLRKGALGMWIGFIGLRIGTGSWVCEHDNETSVSIKGGEYLIR